MSTDCWTVVRIGARWVGCLLIATCSLAQPDPRLWDAGGMAVRQGHHLKWEWNFATDADGYTCIAWGDSRHGPQQIFAQLLDPSGNPLWPDGGIELSDTQSRKKCPVVIAAEEAWIIAWIDWRFAIEPELDEVAAVAAQRIDRDGNLLWSEEGLIIFYHPGTSLVLGSVRLVPDSTDGAIITWTTHPEPCALMAQHITGNGNLVWAQPVTIAEDRDYSLAPSSHVAPDGQGNLLIAWCNDGDVFVEKIRADSTRVWGDGPGGLPICTQEDYQSRVTICSDFTTGGCYLAWRDERQTYYGDLYMQKVSGAGAVLWEANGRLLQAVTDDFGFSGLCIGPSFVDRQQDGFLVSWELASSDGERDEIHAQKIGADGTLRWAESGTLICDDDSLGAVACATEIISDLQGGGLVRWSSDRIDRSDLYITRIDSTGVPVWPGCGTTIQGIYELFGWKTTGGTIGLSLDSSGISVIYNEMLPGSPTLSLQSLDLDDGSLLLTDPIRIHSTLGGEAFSQQLVTLSESRMGIVWVDTRWAERSLYCQMVDTTGHVELPEHGELFCTPVENSSFTTVPDGNGGLYAAVRSREGGGYDVRATRIDAGGTVICDSSGVLVEHHASTLFAGIEAVEDGLGNCIIAWENREYAFTDYYVGLMKVGPDCQPVWAEPVRWSFGSVRMDHLRLVPGPEGGCIASVVLDTEEGEVVLVTRLSAAGEFLWETEAGSSAGYIHPGPAVDDGAGGIYLFWSERLEDRRKIQLQHVDADGWPFWLDGGRELASTDSFLYCGELVHQPEDGLFVTWIKYNDDYSQRYIQRVSADGTLLWGESGRETDTPISVPNASGGCFSAWSVSYRWIYGVDLDRDGNLASAWWETETGRVIGNHGALNESPVIGSFNPRMKLIVWNSTELVENPETDDTDLYMQIVETAHIPVANDQIPPGAPASFALHPAFPNPFNPSTELRFDIVDKGPVTLKVFDILGRETMVLIDRMMAAGSYRARLDAGGLPSGLYFARLTSSDHVRVQKLMLIK